MTDFPKCVLIVTAEIDLSVEEDWNIWYDEVHLPEALACPGVLGGQRYLSMGEGSVTTLGDQSTTAARTYTTIYELAGPEALETDEFKAMRGWYQFTGKIKATTRVMGAR